MTTMTNDLVDAYLRRLRTALRDLPPARRREIVEEIESHIAQGIADMPSPNEAAIRQFLDQVGDPEELAADARDRLGIVPAKAGAKESWAITLLLAGGFFLPVVGWLIGLSLLWSSEVWTRRDKLIGTLLPPGGLGGVLLLWFMTESGSTMTCVESFPPENAIGEQCTVSSTVPAPWIAPLFVSIVVVSILTAIYLTVRMRRRSAA